MIPATLPPVSAYIGLHCDLSMDVEDRVPSAWPSPSSSTGSNRSASGLTQRLGTTFYTYLGALLVDSATENRPVFSIDVPEALASLRQTLGLSTVNLAQVLRVSRQAIYDWTAGKPVKSENRQRLGGLLELAAAWRDHSASPLGELLREPIADQPALLTLLSAEALDLPVLRARLDALASLHRQAVTARPPSAEELAARFALQPLPEQTQRRTLRSFSGSGRG